MLLQNSHPQSVFRLPSQSYQRNAKYYFYTAYISLIEEKKEANMFMNMVVLVNN